MPNFETKFWLTCHFLTWQLFRFGISTIKSTSFHRYFLDIKYVSRNETIFDLSSGTRWLFICSTHLILTFSSLFQAIHIWRNFLPPFGAFCFHLPTTFLLLPVSVSSSLLFCFGIILSSNFFFLDRFLEVSLIFSLSSLCSSVCSISHARKLPTQCKSSSKPSQLASNT